MKLLREMTSQLINCLTQIFYYFYNLVNMPFLPAIQIKFCRSDEISPKLGRGIEEAMLLAKEHAVKGVIQIILIISADGTSR